MADAWYISMWNKGRWLEEEKKHTHMHTGVTTEGRAGAFIN
jgi:hypothetical protein